MYLKQFFVEGLGCASYLVGCEAEGVAAVIDPDRDVQRYIEAAAARGLTITHVIETHLHADHVSGNTDLAARTGAQIYIHEAAQAEFAHQPLQDGDVLLLGTSC
jgi:hydroxyacylglutathione hydrolase